MKKYKIILTQPCGEDDTTEFHSLLSMEYESLTVIMSLSRMLQEIFPNSNAVIIEV